MLACRFHRLPLTHIIPAGMLGNLLAKQADGLTGRMPFVFPDVGSGSAWLGGSGESWERGPYYLDGLVPLAFLTDDPALRARVEMWMAALFASQRADGFFGPATNDDWWPRFVAMKAVQQYAAATGSGRALAFLRRFCDHMILSIEKRPPEFWAYVRGLEAFPAVVFVAVETGDPRYERLLATLVSLTFGWTAFFRRFPYPEPTTRYLNRTLFLALKPILALLDRIAKRRKKAPAKTGAEIAAKNRRPANVRYLTTHGVNLAMAVKYPVYEAFLEGRTDAGSALDALDELLAHHGTAVGVFSSDEHLDGPSPDRGIELCAVVELMHSLAETLVFTGDVRAADRLERLAYNALPATFTSDLCAHQYLQQTDQPEATVKRRRFYDAGPRSTTFGVAPNFGCCAANLHQGFPKFAATAVLAEAEAATVFLFVAGTYEIPFDGGKAVLRIETSYPFSDAVQIVVTSCDVAGKALFVRRPFGAETSVNGVPASDDAGRIALTGAMRAGDAFTLAFAFPIETVRNADGTASVRRGPLLFAEKYPAEEVFLGGVPPFHDRAFTSPPRSRPALLLENGEVVVEAFCDSVPKPDFYANDRGVAVAAFDPATQKRVTLRLHPYGTTTLRRTHFETVER